jgi:hypothetical protein
LDNISPKTFPKQTPQNIDKFNKLVARKIYGVIDDEGSFNNYLVYDEIYNFIKENYQIGDIIPVEISKLQSPDSKAIFLKIFGIYPTKLIYYDVSLPYINFTADQIRNIGNLPEPPFTEVAIKGFDDEKQLVFVTLRPLFKSEKEVLDELMIKVNSFTTAIVTRVFPDITEHNGNERFSVTALVSPLTTTHVTIPATTNNIENINLFSEIIVNIKAIDDIDGKIIVRSSFRNYEVGTGSEYNYFESIPSVLKRIEYAE